MHTLKDKFDSIYNTNYPKVYRLCLGYTNGNEVLSKDLAQETFLKVWQNLDKFRQESSLSTWIYRITVNTCLIELRKTLHHVSVDHLNQSLEIDENSAKQKEKNLDQLYQCIQLLKASDKSIILLELEGLPQKEIADIMGMTHEAIRVRVYRIKKELTKCVKK